MNHDNMFRWYYNDYNGVLNIGVININLKNGPSIINTRSNITSYLMLL